MSRGPLQGVRVLELGSFIAGPFAGQLLGDYGAEVIKVETPGEGDAMRRWGTMLDGEGLWWPSIARNKKSVTLDLRDPRGRDLARRLCGRCDIVLENFRPGRLAEWGLDHATLSRDNPRLVTVHISGFGQSGPRAGSVGFGSVGEAVGGIRYVTGSPDRAPARSGISLGDALAALFAVIGAVAAYSRAQCSGHGQQVDVAIYEAVLALMESTLADYELAGLIRERSGSVLPGVAPSNAYPTADGAQILIAGNSDSVFARLCEAMKLPDLHSDPRFADHQSRGDNMGELDTLIAEWTATHDAEPLLALLDRVGVPAGRIYTAPDMLGDPHFEAREMVLRRRTNGRTVPMPGVVPKFEGTPGDVRSTGPALGEHTRSVLTTLAGIDERTCDELEAAGVI